MQIFVIFENEGTCICKSLLVSIFHNIFKYMIFQRRQKALIWSKRISHFSCVISINTLDWKQYSCMENNGDPDQLVSSDANCLVSEEASCSVSSLFS